MTEYYKAAGLLEPLEQLGFGVVGYGCTTCIGNSGPLDTDVAPGDRGQRAGCRGRAVRQPQLRGPHPSPGPGVSYLASPPLVVAFALAGTVETDLLNEPLGTGSDGKPVMLADIWPSPEEVSDTIAKAVSPDIFRRIYA